MQCDSVPVGIAQLHVTLTLYYMIFLMMKPMPTTTQSVGTVQPFIDSLIGLALSLQYT